MQNEPDFSGTVGTTYAESVPWWPTIVPHSPRRPNVILIILDDTGWSDLGCYGSEISTPAIDNLAHSGLRFNQFHVTPLCSPTRASLLSGRDHHSIGMRFLADTDTGFPNSRGAIRGDVKLLPQILRESGFGTYLVGKWHLAPLHEVTPAGPYQNWPLARGFDHFYGFLDGCTDQYQPELYEDNHAVDPPSTENYHLSEDLADRATAYIRNHAAYRPEDPFFLQLAFGATHAPFQAPREYIDKYVDVFRKGWDQTRQDRLTAQIEAGLVPAGTGLAERNDGVPAWNELSAAEQEVFAHEQAAFAGFLEHTDRQIGRLLEAVDGFGIRDDTIVMLLSDNGASREGGRHGDVDANASYSGVRRTAAEQTGLLENLGGRKGPGHYPEGWAMAGNTPFRLYKQFVDLGGVRTPLIVSWPNGALQRNETVVSDFMHAIDLAPTLLDLLNVPQECPMDGESLAPKLRGDASCGGRRTQFWEMLGHRAIWNDGWKAITVHTPGTEYSDDRWRLYNTAADFSEIDDLSGTEPERLRRLQELWWQLAREYDAFPLDDRPLHDLLEARAPRGLFAASKLTLWPGQDHIPLSSGITGSNRSLEIAVRLRRPPADSSGTLISSGNVQGGYLLYLHNGTLVFEHSFLGELTRIVADLPSPSTARILGARLAAHRDRSSDVELFAGPDVLATGIIPRNASHLAFWGLDIARISGTTFARSIRPPFAAPDGLIEKIEFTITPTCEDVLEFADAVLAME